MKAKFELLASAIHNAVLGSGAMRTFCVNLESQSTPIAKDK